MKNYPKGSMGAAEQKGTKIFLICASLVYALILALLLFIPNYLHDFVLRAPVAANIIGVIVVLVSLGLIWVWSYHEVDSRTWRWLVILGLLVLGICIACGFNFSLFGIADRP